MKTKITIIIPCLREFETLDYCINSAKASLIQNSIPGEIIVANNGGKDECYQIALNNEVGVILVEKLGYGNALMSGIAEAKSQYILFADADGSYDFGQIKLFYDELEKGYDLVMGCRLPSGGGKIEVGAMPFSHQYIGNPFFSFLIQSLFACPLKDPNCGMRAFKKDFFESLKLESGGMEFASEFLIKAAIKSKNITEIPITLYKDRRIKTQKHLKTIRDGFRHLFVYIKYWIKQVLG